ncbi:MAG: CIA30 family protein [Cyclobacterium sp.]|uniref:CIA30 family protein n=1 Tax=Cyclobacterium sp. TaxID=1966343 RepID=UPI003970506F
MKEKMWQLELIAMMVSKLLLFDFSASDDWSAWEIENDVVMGGNSSSKLERSAEGIAIFKGKVSLENNGGFASLQYHFSTKTIKGYKKALILLKGDGKAYQFRMKSSLKDKASYIYTFQTTGDWETVEVPLNEMEPVFRGKKLDLPNFSADTIQEIRFLIGNKKAEDFRLEIKKIELDRNQ